MQTQDIAQSLRDLAYGESLTQLTSLLDEFNIFDAVGLTHQEVRHSTFLAFLLSPCESHGLRDQVLKTLLQYTDFDLCEPIDFSDAEVRREWRNIDVLVYSPKNRVVLLIENKVFTTEHDDQLKRYYDMTASAFPGCVLKALYLTREGDSSSHADYFPISYTQLCRAVENVVSASPCASNTSHIDGC